MGNCCVQNRVYDSNNTTYITYSDIIQDGEYEEDEEFMKAQESLFHQSSDKNLSFKVRLSKFKGKMF
jgi:hypothetical protein